MGPTRATNRLGREKSPYLRQHAHNPVDWYPWGEEAFARARADERPIFLSIGYATCHWCHVMERESFESEEVAAFLNEHFVSIKVDREERPDVDEIYMTTVQALTGTGGWPLSVFLTPEGKPFSGGTYFPQPARYGRRSFLEVLAMINGAWRTERDKVLESAAEITTQLATVTSDERPPEALGGRALAHAVAQLADAFDSDSGGFGRGPTRFPMPHTLSFLLRHHHRGGDGNALQMATSTLDAIVNGGLRDHLAGGFHRYSTDSEWRIPHFEKMLYDQAGLVRALVEGYQVTAERRYADVARETMDYVLREMTGPDGGFTSAWDADSEGVEGKYYVWTDEELRRLLGRDHELFATHYGVTPSGNFHELPGHNHLFIDRPLAELAETLEQPEGALRATIERCRARLLEARKERVPPLHDDKVLTDWNGLMIGAAAAAGRGLGEPRYTDAARDAATFLLERLRAEDGGLLHRYREGEAGIPALLEDHAFLAWGLLELYEASGEPRWLQEADALVQTALASFWDAERGGFYQVPADSELIMRPRPTYDGAIPSGNGVVALVLLRLGTALGRDEYLERGRETLESYSHTLAREGGHAATLGLQALDLLLGPRNEVVVAGALDAAPTQALLAEVQRRFLPRTVLLQRAPDGSPDAEALLGLVPHLRAQGPRDGQPIAYVCAAFACQTPAASPEELARQLGSV